MLNSVFFSTLLSIIIDMFLLKIVKNRYGDNVQIFIKYQVIKAQLTVSRLEKKVMKISEVEIKS